MALGIAVGCAAADVEREAEAGGMSMYLRREGDEDARFVRRGRHGAGERVLGLGHALAVVIHDGAAACGAGARSRGCGRAAATASARTSPRPRPRRRGPCAVPSRSRWPHGGVCVRCAGVGGCATVRSVVVVADGSGARRRCRRCRQAGRSVETTGAWGGEGEGEGGTRIGGTGYLRDCD